MKPFNLEEALAGARVVTRGGMEVTNIRKIGDLIFGHIAQIKTRPNWSLEGYYWDSEACHHQDLFMYEQPEKVDKPKGDERPPQRIVCAAIRQQGTGLIICGARHFDPLMHAVIKQLGGRWNDADQGFIDQFGTYLTREEALIIAKEQDQIRRRCGGDTHELFSENLY